jgi:hypothetical protein
MRASMLPVLIALGMALAFGQDTGKLGSLSGRVVNSATGEGIRRADVVMRGSAGGAMRGDRTEQTARAATTDAEGKFVFEGVEAGNYFLMVQKQGYVAARQSGIAGRSIRVTAGQEVSGLEYKVQPQAVITGRVVDDEGEPVQGIPVMVMQRRFMNGKRRWMQSNGGTTNDLGEFRIFNLPPGKVVVSAMPNRGRAMAFAGPLVATQFGGEVNEQQYVPTYYPNAFDSEQATVIETKPGQTISNVDIQLRRGTVFRISGRVIDPESQGGPMRFGVSAMRSDDTMRGGEGASTKPDGTFEIRGVRPGTYTLTATTYDQRMSAGQRRLGVARLDVSGDVEGVNIEIKSGFKVSGTVAIQTANTGEKADPKSASIMFAPAEQGMFFGPPPQVTVAADGTWSAESVTPGVYRLNAMLRSTDGAPSYVAAVTVGGEDYLGRELDMTQGPVGPIRVVMSTNSGTINGTLDTSDASSEGASFAVAIPVEAKFRLVDQVRPSQVAQDGSYSIRGLRPGEYLVFAFDQYQSGALEDPEIFKQVEQKGVRVKVTAGQASTAQVKLTPWPEEAMGQ